MAITILALVVAAAAVALIRMRERLLCRLSASSVEVAAKSS